MCRGSKSPAMPHTRSVPGQAVAGRGRRGAPALPRPDHHQIISRRGERVNTLPRRRPRPPCRDGPVGTDRRHTRRGLDHTGAVADVDTLTRMGRPHACRRPVAWRPTRRPPSSWCRLPTHPPWSHSSAAAKQESHWLGSPAGSGSAVMRSVSTAVCTCPGCRVRSWPPGRAARLVELPGRGGRPLYRSGCGGGSPDGRPARRRGDRCGPRQSGRQWRPAQRRNEWCGPIWTHHCALGRSISTTRWRPTCPHRRTPSPARRCPAARAPAIARRRR